jgi:hypothetical protein
VDGRTIIRGIGWACGGLLIGVLATANWPAGIHYLRAEWPIPGALAGAVVGLLAMLIWEARKHLQSRYRVSSLTIKLPLGEMKIEVAEGERQLLWRFFVELVTRIATQELASEEGIIREALSSLYGLFALARTELAAVPPRVTSSPGEATVHTYVLKVLNEELRPFLARWHPRLSAWERTGMPEARWPLSALCRQDLATTRGRVLIHAWALGEALNFEKVKLKQYFPDLPDAPGARGELIGGAQLAAKEQELFGLVGADRSKAGWRIFVEVASRIATQPLAPGEGVLREALQSLYTLFGAIRDELKAMLPTPVASGENTIEVIALTILNEHLRPFLAKWHPRLLAWEQHWEKKKEAEWPEAETFRSELAALRRRIAEEAEKLGPIVGVGIPDVKRMLGSEPYRVSRRL